MLTKDKITQNVEGLTEEQINKLTELSKNDEDQVIQKKIGEIHSQYDRDIKEITGAEKKADEKTYDFVKRVLKSDQEKTNNLAEEKKKLESQVEELKKKQSQSGDEKTAKELKDTQTKLENLQKEYDKVKKQVDEKEKQIKDTQIDFNLDKAMTDTKVKSSIPDSAKEVLLKEAKNKIKNQYNPEFDNEGNMVFRDKDGNLLTNPENKMQPFQPQELVKKTMQEMQILEDSKSQTGNGSTGGNGNGNGNTNEVLANAKTQVEASDLISQELSKEGYQKGTKEFADKQSEMWQNYEVSKLPTK